MAGPSPQRTTMIRATRRAIAVQIGAIVAAILLASPDFIDRFLRPSLCHCWDFRGLAVVIWAMFFTPAVLTLAAVALSLRPGRVWPAWVAAALDLALLGLIAYGFSLAITRQWAPYDAAPSVPVQAVQALLVFASDLASLVLLIRLLRST